MALLERLTGINHVPATHGPRISIAVFSAMLRERARGRVTNAELLSELGLSAEDVSDLRRWYRRLRSEAESWEEPQGRGAFALIDEAQDVLSLAEAGARYSTLAALRARLIQP